MKINTAELIQKAVEYEEALDSSKLDRSLSERESFLNKFPISRLLNLTLDEYSTGFSKDSFVTGLKRRRQMSQELGEFMVPVCLEYGLIKIWLL